MQHMTLNEMLIYKKLAGLSCIEISEKSGVPLSTVQKVFSRTTSVPRHKTLTELSKAFEEYAKDRLFVCDPAYEAQILKSIGNKKSQGSKGNGITDSSTDNLENIPVSHVEDVMTEYIASGSSNALDLSLYKEKTINDYLSLPNDVRVELIDGVFYDMAAPSYLHQQISAFIWRILQNHIDSNKGKCSAALSPIDVQLDSDNKTMVQPDVMVICDRSKITGPRVVGAPDFIIEVVSDSNMYHDVFRKKLKYQNAGVREYWMVFPKEKEIQVFFFEKSYKPIGYTFNDSIPVNIWDGKCCVNFKEISEALAYLMN